jgi:hypothetical protein
MLKDNRGGAQRRKSRASFIKAAKVTDFGAIHN